jgi:hypothetical protein
MFSERSTSPPVPAGVLPTAGVLPALSSSDPHAPSAAAAAAPPVSARNRRLLIELARRCAAARGNRILN